MPFHSIYIHANSFIPAAIYKHFWARTPQGVPSGPNQTTRWPGPSRSSIAAPFNGRHRLYFDSAMLFLDPRTLNDFYDELLGELLAVNITSDDCASQAMADGFVLDEVRELKISIYVLNALS
jgi:hypothetical protein